MIERAVLIAGLLAAPALAGEARTADAAAALDLCLAAVAAASDEPLAGLTRTDAYRNPQNGQWSSDHLGPGGFGALRMTADHIADAAGGRLSHWCYLHLPYASDGERDALLALAAPALDALPARGFVRTAGGELHLCPAEGQPIEVALDDWDRVQAVRLGVRDYLALGASCGN